MFDRGETCRYVDKRFSKRGAFYISVSVHCVTIEIGTVSHRATQRRCVGNVFLVALLVYLRFVDRSCFVGVVPALGCLPRETSYKVHKYHARTHRGGAACQL